MINRRLLEIGVVFSFLCVCHADVRIAGIRFHGNYSIPDEELRQLVELKPGMTVSEADLKQVRSRLLRTGRFESVEVRRRYGALQQNSRVFLIIAVKEKVPFSKKIQFGPLVHYADEYGFTYGGRTTFEDVLGAGERLSFPLTWGGVREAASESRFPARLGVADSALGTARIRQAVNPAFDRVDRRTELEAGLEKRLDRFRYGVNVGWSDVSFGGAGDSFSSVGAEAALDTRRTRILPRNAVYAGLDWKHVAFGGDAGHQAVHRFRIDLRGYRAFLGRSVLAGQVLLLQSTGPLPDYLKPFIGGGSTLRGYPAGRFVGDQAALTSVELRIPLTPPGTVYRGGIDLFFDTGTTYDHGTSLRDGRFHNGVGGGFWLFVFGLGLKADLGYDLDHSVRLNVGTGLRF